MLVEAGEEAELHRLPRMKRAELGAVRARAWERRQRWAAQGRREEAEGARWKEGRGGDPG